MGDNADIKGFDLTPQDGALTLFATKKSREDAVRALLESPWLKRASAMEYRPVSLGKAYHEGISVRWDAEKGVLIDFIWRGGRHLIDDTLGVWSRKDGWWRQDQGTDKIFVRVSTQGGVYDLSIDRSASEWMLEGMAD